MREEVRRDAGLQAYGGKCSGDGKFVDETFFKAGMEYFKKSHPDAGNIKKDCSLL